MSKNRKSTKDGCLLPFHYVQYVALVAGVQSFNGNPAGLSPRALVEADSWAHFRLRSLRFRLHPASSAPTDFQVAVWVPGVQDTPPATQGNAAEILNCAVLGSRTTVPTSWVNVMKEDLAGPLPWYKSITGTADATEEAPGAVYALGSTTNPVCIEFAGVFEFKGAVASANTPMALKLLAELRAARAAHSDQRAREKVVALLGTRPTG